MADHPLTRRDFVRTGAVAAAGAAVALQGTAQVAAGNPAKVDTSTILNYNPDMEYRRCGKTNLMVSAVCLGGHWKRANEVVPGLFEGGNWLGAKLDSPEFEKNRSDVVTRSIERGINYIDACTGGEVLAYSKALKGRRDKMYLGYSWYEEEMRGLGSQWANAKKAGKPMEPGWITKKLKDSFDAGLKRAGLEYVDLWRITCHEGSSAHSDEEMDEMAAALEWAKKSGKARFTGISSHDQPHIKKMIAKYPAQLEVICTPFNARTRASMKDQHGLYATMKELDVGWFGIKPFASNSLFKGDSTPGNKFEKQDSETARLAIRRILGNQVITAPIPGLITIAQADNAVAAVKEPRELTPPEQARLDHAMDRAWANLPYHYRWLKDWDVV
jgi:aryl-alcohol dehydrogenase-like predicted oxidoreductase